MHLNWGDVPTWGLLIGAVVTAYLAGRAFQAQSAQLRSQLEEQLRAQANKVAAWGEGTPSMSKPCRVRILNASDLPVYDVIADFTLGIPARLEADEPLPFLGLKELPVIEPGGKPSIEFPSPLPRMNPEERRDVEDWKILVSIKFTDAAGKRWKRDFDGSLLLQGKPPLVPKQRLRRGGKAKPTVFMSPWP